MFHFFFCVLLYCQDEKTVVVVVAVAREGGGGGLCNLSDEKSPNFWATGHASPTSSLLLVPSVFFFLSVAPTIDIPYRPRGRERVTAPDAKLIVVVTKKGHLARLVAKFRPNVPVSPLAFLRCYLVQFSTLAHHPGVWLALVFG